MDVVAHENAAQFLEDEDQPVRHQYLLQMLALVKIADEAPFERVAEDDREHETDGERGEEAAAQMRGGPRRQRIGEVGADHVEAAVCEVDDAEDAEDQRQAARDEKQQQPVLQGVEALDQKYC